MTTTMRRRRQAGQTVVLLALLLGIIMVILALVIDNGTHHRVRAETRYVADAASLAGMAEILASGDPTLARQKALAICAANGYQVGQDGVTSIQVWSFRADNYNATTNQPQDVPNSDRYHCKISRELPQFFASTFGFRRAGVTQWAVAAIIGAVPIDIDFDSEPLIGFPTRANLAQFGPDALYEFGDWISTRLLPNGAPNPLYDLYPEGYQFDMFVPADLQQSTGSTFVRFELFDPDTYNDPAKAGGSHVVKDPVALQDTDGDASQPERGAMDEIRATRAEGGNSNTSPAQFAARSTTTRFRIIDAVGTIVAEASYGPTGNTPFWYHDQAPGGASPPTDPAASGIADVAQQQRLTDLKWVTPLGFEFDTSAYTPPFRIFAKTMAGASENGYSMRVSTQRADGEKYDQLTHGLTNTSALAIYGRGRVPINFVSGSETGIPIGNVPAAAQTFTVTNFDTDVGSQYAKYTMKSFDRTTGKNYPILWPAAANASPTDPDIVVAADGTKYRINLRGTLSGNGTSATDSYDVPDNVPVPETDADGNLVFDANGRITIRETRAFEGADLLVSYRAGAHDTSVWEVSFTGPGGSQQILLIR